MIFYVAYCYILVKPEHVKERKKKPHKYFRIVEDGQFKELLGVRYQWKLFYFGDTYVVMSMNENAEEIIEQYEKLTQVIG